MSHADTSLLGSCLRRSSRVGASITHPGEPEEEKAPYSATVWYYSTLQE